MKRVFCFGLALYFMSIVSAFAGDRLTVLTEDWPPYSYESDGRVVGLSADLVVQTLARAGFDYSLNIKPWKRAYKETLSNKATILFTTSRTEQREKMFKWVGPLFPRKIVLYRLKRNKHIVVNSFDDLRKYKIGVLRGGSVEEILKARGFEQGCNYDEAATNKQNILKLFLNRIDLIPGSEVTMAHRMKSTSHKFSDLEMAFVLVDQGGYYIAVNKETPDDVVRRIQGAFDSLIAEGGRDKIIKTYLGDLNH
ncbi:substrate-binding periplasmic protein [Maridesulfovibrio salexigens]|uniref:Extracellular solute-binding protein family 3 n=1 Tax=Maridesulfovibrio salexigens (strain ATCC 14822 / DSM 2638 / NCIMB 8403 / VKM B-1763) TaxID=526222 RepID=C6BRL6_MARSD|nr:transporter substrate-binding domain-containing protein [Maridesulfovibrio salexigens]ACS79456.1 extracellular solute-binding protein family 3 [Maridesulfovibrio salexigens DSM 2638]